MAEQRPVEVDRGYSGKKSGKFHQFGQSPFSDDSGQYHTKTVAIVELDDGQVIEVDPKSMKFTDR